MFKKILTDSTTFGSVGMLFFLLSFSMNLFRVEGRVWPLSNEILIGLSIVCLAAAMVLTLIEAARSRR